MTILQVSKQGTFFGHPLRNKYSWIEIDTIQENCWRDVLRYGEGP